MIRNITMKYKQAGIFGVLLAIYRRVFSMKAKAYSLIKEIVSAGKGLEVGGLSSIFQHKNVIPIYRHIKSSYLEHIQEDKKRFFKEVAKIVLFENDKVRKVCFILLGLWHGKLEKYGKLDA